MSSLIKSLTTATFDNALAATNKLVLIDFMADWCMPCKQIAPTIEEIAADYADALFVAKVNADESPELLERFEVRGLPTLLLIKGGQEAARAFVLTKTRLAAMIEAHLQ